MSHGVLFVSDNDIPVAGLYDHTLQRVVNAQAGPVTNDTVNGQPYAPLIVSGTMTGTMTTIPQPSSTAALSSVAGAIATGVLLPANVNRKAAFVYNDSTANLYLAFAATASLTVYTVKLATNTAYSVPTIWQGVISGIWDAAAGSARLTELT